MRKPDSGENVAINRFCQQRSRRKLAGQEHSRPISVGRKLLEFGEGRIVPVMYRPFTGEWLYFSRRLNEMVYQMPRIFPHADAGNRLICVTGIGARSFSVLMVDKIPEVQLVANGQCFPLHLYEKLGSDNGLFDQQSGATDAHGYTRRDAITDDALAKFRDRLRQYRFQARHLSLYLRPASRPILPPPLRQQSFQRAAAYPARRQPRSLHRPRLCRTRVRRSTRRLRPR